MHPQTIFEIVEFPDIPLLKGNKMSGEYIDTAATSIAMDLGLQQEGTVTFRVCNYVEPNKVSFYIGTQGAGISAMAALCSPDYTLRTINNSADRMKIEDMGPGISVYELHRKLISHLRSKEVNTNLSFSKPLVTGFDWERIFHNMMCLPRPVQLQLKVCRYHNDNWLTQLQNLRFNMTEQRVNENLIKSLSDLINADLYAANIHVFAASCDDAALIAQSIAGDSFSVNQVQCNQAILEDILYGGCYYGNHRNEAAPPIVDNICYIFKRREVDMLFQLPYACSEMHRHLPSVAVIQTNPFSYEGRTSSQDDEHHIAVGYYRSGAPYGIPLIDLLSHSVIFGKSGFGKTLCTLGILKQLVAKHIPVLIIESAKTEYYNALKPLFREGELKVYNFKNPYGTDFFRINPMLPMQNTCIAQHISIIKGCFMAAIPMYGATPHVFESMLYDFYKNIICDGDESLMYKAAYVSSLDADKKQKLSINHLYKYVDIYIDAEPELFADNADNDFASVLKRRLARLSENSMIAHAFDPYGIQADVAELFQQPTLIELDALSDDSDKALVMSIVLAYLDEYKKQGPQLVDVLKEEPFDAAKHVNFLFIEEAHRLLSAKNMGSNKDGGTENGQQKFISLFCDLLAEIRARGTGLFLVEQSPSALVTEVIRQCNFNITHRLTEEVDRNCIGGNMNMTKEQKQYLSVLGKGKAVVYEARLDKPAFVSIHNY